MPHPLAAIPLYATCPHCNVTLQCFTNHAKETKLPSHFGAGNRIACPGGGMLAENPRPRR